MGFFDDVRRYLDINHAAVLQALVQHIWLSLLPVAIAFAIALPVGWAVVRYRWLRESVLTLTSVVYTVPSLALLLLLPGVLGTPILGSINVVIALSIYTVALLVRTTADALESVDAGIVEAATAMGYRPARRWFAVELPLALPVVLAGLRVATVSNVSLVSVAGLIGIGGLGQLFTRGIQLNFYAPPIVIGLVLSVALALVVDLLIVVLQRAITPWVRIGGRAVIGYLGYLFDGAHWSWGDPAGFPHRILEHLGYSAAAFAVAVVIAFPLGMLIGHTNRGAFFAINVGNAGRALPTLGVLTLVLVLVGFGLTPVIVSLVVLAVPPILTTTYAGVRSVSGATVDAARGVGMTETQIALRIEPPNALPIIFGGFRNAALQVISTATLAAYVGLGGLGRFLFDGLGVQDYSRVVGGCVVLAVLAVVVDQAFAVVQRLVVSPGADGRALKGGRRVVADSTAAILSVKEESTRPT